MNENIELKLLKEIEALRHEIKAIKGEIHPPKKTYYFSKIRDIDLESLVDIEKNLDKNIFKPWFDYNLAIDAITKTLFFNLIQDNEPLIESYSEEDLKVNFLIPILNKVHFKSFENKFRDFYEHSLKYETSDFIFRGATDFMVSLGLANSKKPYFFIQEFKRSEEYGNPRPQLLAELISAVELNNWTHIKGAYIIGAMWHFVILEKLEKNKYQYFVSKNFDSMRLDDLEKIYKNLLFVKEEITKEVAKLTG